MPERDYGLGGREARKAYDSAKTDDSSSVRPRARPENKDTSEAPTISIVDADTDKIVADWDVGSGDVTFSGDSALSETAQPVKETNSGLSIPEAKLNIGPLEVKEKNAKLDLSVDWSNVFDNLLRDTIPKDVNLNRFRTSWDGETIKILDVGMSFAEGGKVDDKAQLEMDLIMNEQVDPVSGNTAPIGAKPEEVRDDIEIRVSPGEYVINAQTVRYFGEDFFDELQKAAAEGFERIKEGEELPFRDDELATEEDETEEVEPEGFAYGGRVKGYAEGDLVVPQPVGGGYGQYGGTGSIFTGYQSKVFINDETGQKIIVFFFNGRPLSRIPSGFREMGETPVEEQEEQQQARREDTSDPSDDIAEELRESSEGWRNKNPSEWDEDDYNNYYRDIKSTIDKGEDPLGLSKGEDIILTLLSGPSGVLSKVMGADTALGSLIKKSKKKRAQSVFDTIKVMETATNVQRDTQYLLGGFLGEAGYAKPYTSDELDDSGMPTAQALRDRGIGSMEDRGYTFDPLRGYILTEDTGVPYVRPRARPPVLPESVGKYDPARTSISRANSVNLLSTQEQSEFDRAVSNDDNATVVRLINRNNLRNKKDDWVKSGMSRAEGEKMGLSESDMDSAERDARDSAAKASREAAAEEAAQAAEEAAKKEAEAEAKKEAEAAAKAAREEAARKRAEAEREANRNNRDDASRREHDNLGKSSAGAGVGGFGGGGGGGIYPGGR